MSNTITLYGMYHLVNELVTVSIGGLDCGDYMVAADGSVVVPFGADPDCQLTPGFLQSIAGTGQTVIALTMNSKTWLVNVPVQVGYTYMSQGQLLQPWLQEDIKTQKGSGLAKIRRIAQFGAQFVTTQGVSVGSNFGNINPITFADDPLLQASAPYLMSQLFTGVWRGTIDDTASFYGQLAWQISRPYMCKITALDAFISLSDM